ncbi:MAG: SprT-like domain-containing protein [Chthoniobacteraceae bacterium]
MLFARTKADPRRGSPKGPLQALQTVTSGALSAETLEVSARHLLESIGWRGLAKMIHVQWNPRLRTTAGLANYTHWTVSLNPRIAQFGAAEVDRTLKHELAHLLARYRVGRRNIQPHGAEWKQACIDLGLTDETRCHELPLPRRRMVRKYFYRCRHCHTEVRRVRPFRRAVACLKCCKEYNRGRYDERFRFELIAKG